LGEKVKRGNAEERVNEAVKKTLLDLLDDSFDLEKELEGADEPPVVFLVGFNGSGKCVASDSTIYTDSGPVKAGELFERYSDLEFNETEKGIYVEPGDLNVHSIDQDELDSELKQVSKLWKLSTREIVDIELSTGKEVSVTPEHPFFRLEEGAVVKQSADTLSEGDYIMAPSSLEGGDSEPDLWSRMEKGYYVESDGVAEQIYGQVPEDGSLKELSKAWTEEGFHSDAIQYWRRSGKAPLEVLRKLGIEIPSDARFSAPESKPIGLPAAPSKELAELLGMFVAEGNIDYRSIHIHNQEEEFFERLQQLYLSIFGIEPRIEENDEGLYRVSVGKATISKFFEDAIDMEGSKHSIVGEVMKWPEAYQTSFLRGLFSGDGHVNPDKREIELVSSDSEMVERLRFMLLKQGIVSSVDTKSADGKGYTRIRISGDSKLQTWREKIGFSIDYKRKDLDATLDRNRQYEQTELVPGQGQVLKQLREDSGLTQQEMGERLGVENTMIHHYENDSRISKARLKEYSRLGESQAAEFVEKLAEGDVCWLEIESVEKRESEETVYDLTVPENHNFIANGIVVHNTTTAAKLASYLDREVVLGAGDTFRAASIEQLEEHGENLDVKVISHEYESDPAAVAYDAVEHAEKNDKTAIVDTAGRSHSDRNLMDELEKMVEVNEPDITFLVVDALAGNDVLEQAEAYDDMFDAVIVTKMDVDENGGAIISISQESGKPVAFLGTGQDYGDIEEFDKEEFIEEILE
ncbi:MAG: LAGLIDADG family homing endonuclease, partial [Candidatus Nanohaloarchaea archaeon]